MNSGSLFAGGELGSDNSDSEEITMYSELEVAADSLTAVLVSSSSVVSIKAENRLKSLQFYLIRL